MTPRAIEVDIDELVLEGFDPVERGTLANAIRAELERLLIQRGLPGSMRQTRDVEAVPVKEVALPGDVPAADAGVGIGRAIHQAID